MAQVFVGAYVRFKEVLEYRAPIHCIYMRKIAIRLTVYGYNFSERVRHTGISIPLVLGKLHNGKVCTLHICVWVYLCCFFLAAGT